MRKSREVPLTLLAAVAFSMTACNQETRNCVDNQNRILPDSRCQSGGGGAHFIYGGSSGGRVGDAVVGGSSVSRGGFGAHGSGGE